MEYKEIKGNLFDAPQGFCLAHCIAGDFGMSAGIATQFNDKFDMKNRLQEIYGSVKSPSVIKIDNVFNLITKDKTWNKPTYDSLRFTLISLRDKMIDEGIKKLAIPQIGCGLDRLNWNVVREIIKEVFENTDIQIVVYIFETEKETKDNFSSVKICETPQQEDSTFSEDDYIRCNTGYMDYQNYENSVKRSVFTPKEI